MRDIHEDIVCRRLIGDHVRGDAADDQLRIDIGGVANQPDGQCRAMGTRLLDQRHGFLEVVDDAIHIAVLQPALRSRWIDLHDEADAAVHRDRQWLGAAHAAQAGRQDELALQRRPAA